MNYLLLISIGSFIIYFSIITWIYGLLPSISHSYYKHGKGWLFTLFMWSVGLPICIMANDAWLFYSGAGFCFCGTAPAFKGDDIQARVHSIGVIAGIFLALIHLLLLGQWYYMAAIILFVFITGVYKMKHETLLNEVFSFTVLSTGLSIEFLF